MRRLAEQNSQLAPPKEAAREVHQALGQYLSRRPDLGLDKMLLDMALSPANPFDPQGQRNARKGFLLFLFVAIGLAATFAYFNFLAGGQ